MHPAFLLPPNAAALHTASSHRRLPARPARQSSSRAAPAMAAPSPPTPPSNAPKKRANWLRVALLTAGAAVGGVARPPRADLLPRAHLFAPPAHASPVSDGAGAVKSKPSDVISLGQLGIKRDDFLSDRELRRRKTTQYSEAEQEIMELEEYEANTQWFRDLQLFWAAIASVAGMYVLYKGGVMWENWIKEQEKKDMEEEIELTGTFIDPRAVRKDEDEEDEGKDKKKDEDKGPSSDPSPEDTPDDGQVPPDGIESLEKIFGKS